MYNKHAVFLQVGLFCRVRWAKATIQLPIYRQERQCQLITEHSHSE